MPMLFQQYRSLGDIESQMQVVPWATTTENCRFKPTDTETSTFTRQAAINSRKGSDYRGTSIGENSNHAVRMISLKIISLHYDFP